jgi:Peptidase family M23
MGRVSRRALAGAAAICVAIALSCAGLALADSPPVPTTTDTTTTDTTTTDTTTTTTATVPTDTGTTATAPAPPATTPVVIPPPPTTTKTSTTKKKKPQPHPQGPACVGAGSLLLVLPRQRPRSIGSIAAREPAGTGATALEYPKNGDVLRVAAARADVSGCPAGTTHGTATSSLRRLTLFGGEITVGRIVATLVPAKSAGHRWRLRVEVKDLVIDGQPVTMLSGESLPVGNWGRVKLDGGHRQRGKRALSSVGLAWWQGGLSLHLTKPHAGLPAGTQLLVAYVAADWPYAKLPQAPAGGLPLTVTPPLKGGPYTFPVTGNAVFGDTYGANRSDVPGGWHHGDDIFAPLGQPVVAVANGKVYKVGWNKVGGWRLWLRDAQGNRFYYAHLSGYTKFGKSGTQVKAGQQLGFIGNTGDAFTTPHHLHFEIHPVALLYLAYAGAVDPTKYLDAWKRVEHVTPLAPVPLPAGAATHGDGAVSDYRQLLAVRGVRRPPSTVVSSLPVEERPIPLAAAAGVPSASATSPLVPAITAALLALFGVAGLGVWRRRRASPSVD